MAAVEAGQLAEEARARIKSKNKQDQAEIPDFVKKAFEKPLTEAQVKRELLKTKWCPLGYISVWELLELIGTYKVEDWSGTELDAIANPPKCLQVSDALDLKNIENLIFYAFSNNLIKEGIQQPPNISGDNAGIWQDDWLYLHRVGKFNGAKTKEDAIDGWLKEVNFIVNANRQYNVAYKRVEQVKTFLRDMLFVGKIRAVRVVGKNFESIPDSYWLDDNFAHCLDLSPASVEILFEYKSVQKIIVANEQKVSSQKSLIAVAGGKDVKAAAMAVFKKCRLRGDKLNSEELQELINRILKNKGKILQKSWHKTHAEIPYDLKRQRGEHSKCSLIHEDWPKS